ncbi:MAG: oligosaccharide flippase family protein [Rhodoferax sp.]|uniref:lipopolysaccharide biosynthesis protein n=1 Tax=Rhodoferax sp. TaxID=50421 RepID=UPI002ACEAB4B|nr:oligosaccharide flippase family protein [Rhodoferax sp.]MDZ7892209.1 oligosaccharide flippase family protein [Rhodoferax sp.]
MTAPSQSISRYRTALDLLMLFISKSGAIVVGMFFLPWYQQLLGPEAFGIVALVLSLQAFLLMLDLGTSTLVGRDLASGQSHYPADVTLSAAQLVLHIAYLVLLVTAVAVGNIWASTVSVWQLIACVVFFWALTVQNVGQSALLARRAYLQAGKAQTIGVIVRAVITLAALKLVSANLTTFLLAQTVTAVIQMVATSWLCNRALDSRQLSFNIRPLLPIAREIALRGKPLVLFGLAGAAVMQLDKVIISTFLSPSELAPYFLASVLCLTPISVMAGPITQYFQPRIVASISNGTAKETERQLRLFTTAVICAVAIPSALLWLGRDFVVHAWLHGQSNSIVVSQYVSILLPGIAFGSLGFIPYTLLVAHQDYAAQAGMSTAMTVITLVATIGFAAKGSAEGVCWVYAAYHSLSAVVSWLRAIQLQPPPPHQYASRTAARALVMLLPLAAGGVLIAYAAPHF